MAVKGGGIEVGVRLCRAAQDVDRSDQEGHMGGIGKKIGKKSELPGKDDGKPKKPPPVPVEDDDFEDGDIATPKRDRHGDDDQPL
jgi:hypothetical protein